MPYAANWLSRYAASEIDVLDDFELDANGYANHALTHDAAGNLTYDGVFLYTYDPWNHLTQVHRAYHDGSGVDGDGDGSTADPERGSLVAAFTYDGMGRRVSKAVTHMADLDATYYYYCDGDRCVEVRNGSHDPIKNYVWAPMPVVGDDASVGGPGYVDELVQIIHHLDTGSGAVQTYHWVLQDVNYNVLGVVQTAGALVERYEYAPYGDREVYIQSGVNDGRVQSRTEMSRRIPDGVTMLDEPYGLCAIGHQGLMHDEELGLIHNRARTLHPRLRRFMQRDPAEYVDGMGLYEYESSGPIILLDASGQVPFAGITFHRHSVSLAPLAFGHSWVEINTLWFPPWGWSAGFWPRCQGGVGGIVCAFGMPGRVLRPDPYRGNRVGDNWEAEWDIDGFLYHAGLYGGMGIKTPCACATPWDVHVCLQDFARVWDGAKTYSIIPGVGGNCHTFTDALLRWCCVKKGRQF